MKLYTEKQMKLAYGYGVVDGKLKQVEYSNILDYLIPIELPSDEEIEELMNKNGYYEEDYDNIWREGAKWMKEQILNQNK